MFNWIRIKIQKPSRLDYWVIVFLLASIAVGVWFDFIRGLVNG